MTIDLTRFIEIMSTAGIFVAMACILIGGYSMWLGTYKSNIKKTRERLLKENRELGIKYNVPYKSDTFDEVMFIAEPKGHFNGTVVFSCKKGVYSTRYEYDQKGMQLISMMIKDGTYREI